MSVDVDLGVDEWAAPPDPIAELTAKVEALAKRLAEKEAEKPREPKYATLGEFVGWLTSWYRREATADKHPWCKEWWLHPEAGIRLHAIWSAFEAKRDTDGTWESSWLRDDVDPQMRELLSDQGPFGSCNPEDGHRFPREPLPVSEPPTDWWTKADTGL